MAMNGMAMMLKSLGVDAEAINSVIQSAPQIVKNVDERIKVIESKLDLLCNLVNTLSSKSIGELSDGNHSIGGDSTN